MKKLILTIGVAMMIIGFLVFGRSVYMPILHKIKGRETVESRIDNLEHEVWKRLESKLISVGFKTDFPQEIVLVAFKKEQILQVYANTDNGVTLLKEYPFTAYSGELGPKLKKGDRQIPEGIYKVEYLNPNSSYYLSIKINYPNDYDKSKSILLKTEDMGGDIFIHGKSATIGCIPIGDEAIEEVFVLTQKAINNEVKVIISPKDFRIDDEYPQIESIDWEIELYDEIKTELNALFDSVTVQP
jgi:murein L,D-transpeptidase YafK